jgi:hypothetical protein
MGHTSSEYSSIPILKLAIKMIWCFSIYMFITICCLVNYWNFCTILC